MSQIPATRNGRWYAALLGIVLEVVCVLPFAAASPNAVLGIPPAISIAIATAVAVLVGTLQGAVVAEAGALVFAVAVSDFHPGGIAALAVWPLLTVLAGLFGERVRRLRASLEQEVEQANERLRALVETGIGLGAALDLDRLLRLVVEAAPALTGARAASLELVGRRRGGERLLSADAPVAARSAALSVPILLRGIAYGHLHLAEKADGGAYTHQDHELVELLAAQAAVAVENRRLYEAASRWSWQLESLTEVSTALSAELEVPALMRLVAASLRRLVDARAAAVFLPGPDGLLRPVAAEGELTDEITALPPLGPDSKTGRAFESGRSSRVDSLLDDPEVDQAAVKRLDMTAALWLPLSVGRQRVGVLVAWDKRDEDRRFSDEDERVAQVFAARAAASVAAARRAEEEALRKVVAAQEAERQRIALALHDGTAQQLASILMQLRTAEPELDEVRRLLVATLQDVRRMAVELHPKALDDFGLVPALERLAETFGESTRIDVHLQASLDGVRLPTEAEAALFRIVQEALENVAQHAGAEHASVLLVRRNGAVGAVVEDDGRGFDPAAETEGYGLAGIRERVRLLGGTLTVESREGAGSTIAVEIPLA